MKKAMGRTQEPLQGKEIEESSLEREEKKIWLQYWKPARPMVRIIFFYFAYFILEVTIPVYV